jgi:hypothetical protein
MAGSDGTLAIALPETLPDAQYGFSNLLHRKRLMERILKKFSVLTCCNS